MRASAANTIRAWGCFGRAERKQLRPRILFGRAERQQLQPRNHVVHAGGGVDSKARETVRDCRFWFNSRTNKPVKLFCKV